MLTKNKRCSKCKELKPYSEFYKSKDTKIGLFSWCKQCCRTYQSKYKEVKRKYMLEYRKKNPNKKREWIENNREHLRKYAKQHYYEDIENHRIYSKIAKARRKGAEGSYTIQEWEDLKYACGYRCMICGNKEPFLNQKYHFLTPDHIIPISKGGSNYIVDILPLCLSCNTRKEARGPEWYIKMWVKQRKENLKMSGKHHPV